MNRNPFFSIITVTFNSGKTLERTINSVLKQTYSDFEYIIVDGGSNDETLEIIKKYEPLFNNQMRWKSEPDHGIYDAMNKGIGMATGEVIGIVNSDDWLELNALETVVKAIQYNGNDKNSLYCGDIIFHYGEGVKKRKNSDISLFKRKASLYEMYGIKHPATFVPRLVYDKVGLFNDQMKLSADQDFVLRCYFKGVKLYHVNNVLSNMSSGGISTAGTRASLAASIHDRKMMLMENNIHGIQYLKLWYPWRLRAEIKRIIRKYKLFF